jgi:hypothetical protein
VRRHSPCGERGRLARAREGRYDSSPLPPPSKTLRLERVAVGRVRPVTSSSDSGTRRRLVAGLAAALAVLLGAAPSARAELPRVIVASLSGDAPAEGLLEAVAIQLSGTARVEAGPQLGGASSNERVEVARNLAYAEGAALVVWVDARDVSGEAGSVLHIVGPRSNGEPELVSSSEVPEGNGPEIERALALKVREALDQRMWSEVEEHDEELELLEEPEEEEELLPTAPVRWMAPIAEAGLGASGIGGSIGAQAEVFAGAGITSGGAGIGRFEVLAALRMPAAADVANAAGRVRIEEMAAGLDARYLIAHGSLSAGAHTSVWVRRISAFGEAATGETGAAVRYVPVSRLGPEFRWQVLPHLSLRAAGLAEISIYRRWFTLHGERVSDLGRFRLGLSAGVVASW